LTRADRLAALVVERELDALLVNDPVNLRYVTGFTGTNGLAVVGAGNDGVRRFLTDFRYVERAEREVTGFDRLRGERDLLESLRDALAERRPLRLGFDDAHVSVKSHRRLSGLLDEGVELVPAGGLVEQLRMVKEPGELERIAAAAALADEALVATLTRGLAGRTEREVALDLEDEMRHHGAQAPSFPSIVAAGPNGALPHAEAGYAEVPGGVLVIVDWGSLLDGYCSDCTRTFATGRLDGEVAEVYDLVLRAQQAGLEAVRPGPTGREVDRVAREVIEAAGHGEEFGHGLGHGVGLEVHERPTMSKVVVTEDGPRVLSSHPKELTEVD
jgi:Xaa-Pro aminopeptidase